MADEPVCESWCLSAVAESRRFSCGSEVIEQSGNTPNDDHHQHATRCNALPLRLEHASTGIAARRDKKQSEPAEVEQNNVNEHLHKHKAHDSDRYSTNDAENRESVICEKVVH